MLSMYSYSSARLVKRTNVFNTGVLGKESYDAATVKIKNTKK